MRKLIVFLLLSVSAALAQPQIKDVILSGTGAPGMACLVKQEYVQTDATAGQNLWLCTSTDVWTQQTGTPAGAAFSTIGASIADAAGDTLTVSDGLGIDFTTADDPEDLSAELNYSQTLAGNPGLGAEECVFTTDGAASGGLLCEGTIANDNEQLYLFPSLDGADTTTYFALGASDGDALAGDSATGFFDAGTLEDARVDGSLEEDEITAENLGSACTDIEVLGGDGAGGVECQADAGGGAGALGANQADTLEVERTSPTVLTVNPDATASAPVNVRVGNTNYQFTSTATFTIDSGSESCDVRTYVKDDGVIYVGVGTGCTIGNYTCAGCTKEASDVFPSYAITSYQWGITSGNFDAAAATQDKRGFLSTSPTKCGTGLTCAVSSGIVTVSLDASALGPDVTTLNITEEFITRLTGAGYIGELGWAAGGTGGGALDAAKDGVIDHPGLLDLSSNNTATSGYGISLNNFTTSECCDDLHAETYFLDWVFKMETAPVNKKVKLGLANGFAAGEQNNQISVKCYTDTDTNWQFKVCAGGSCASDVDTGIACSSTDWHRLRVFRASGDASGRVKMCMDDCGSSTEFTTNVPTVALSPYASIFGDGDSATDEDLTLDYMALYMEGLTRW